jgi:hypothetical protein
MSAVTVPISFSSPSAFAVAKMPRSSVLEHERRVRFLVVSGRQDDSLWGPIGALWLSDDGARGGFLVNPYALWNGSEIARSYRSAQKRGWRPEAIFDYWSEEIWRGPYSIDEEQGAETLALLADLVNAL